MRKDDKKQSTRQLKKILKTGLKENEPEVGAELVRSIPPAIAVNPVISFFCSADKVLRWRSVTAIGEIVEETIRQDGFEKARIIIRRLMWTLNEESGGVGWGAPEAMGEIMARVPKLAEEYHRILFSYIDDHGNYLDYAPLREGVLWGIDRLAQVRPEMCIEAVGLTGDYLAADTPFARGIAAVIAGRLKNRSAKERLRVLTADTALFELYQGGYFKQKTIGSAAEEALALIG